jgi:hypothetical protein
MKRFFLILFVAAYATAIFSQVFWTFNNNYALLSPATTSLGIGIDPAPYMKFCLKQYSDFPNTTYGLYSMTTNVYSGDGSACGIFSSSSTGSSTTGTNYGMYLTTNSGSSTANTYCLYSNAYKSGSTGTVYGVYSYVSGGAKRYAGYFSGGDVYVSGNVGVGTTSPNTKLDIVSPAAGLYVSAKNLDRSVDGPYDITFLKNTGCLLLGWNYRRGSGEQSLISNRGAGDRGGFGFYDYSNSGEMTTLMTISRIRGSNATIMLDVYGVVRATEVKVCLNQGCDFVFDKGYKLMSLHDLNTFVTETSTCRKLHLPPKWKARA